MTDLATAFMYIKWGMFLLAVIMIVAAAQAELESRRPK